MDDRLFRVTIKGKGFFSVLKECFDQKEWHQFLERSAWLPNPGEEIYEKYNCATYFTEKGYEKFVKEILPSFAWLPIFTWIGSESSLPYKLLYEDEYQKVFDKGDKNNGQEYL